MVSVFIDERAEKAGVLVGATFTAGGMSVVLLGFRIAFDKDFFLV